MQSAAIKSPSKPRALGPKQIAWCDANLGNFGAYRQGVEQVIAETEASRRAAGLDVERKPDA